MEPRPVLPELPDSADSRNAGRQRLAWLLGRILARHWLRSRASAEDDLSIGTTIAKDDPSKKPANSTILPEKSQSQDKDNCIADAD